MGVSDHLPLTPKQKLPYFKPETMGFVEKAALDVRVGQWLILTVRRHFRSALATRTSSKPLAGLKRAIRGSSCYSITSSARASKFGGISTPSAFAVLRLMAISNLTGACAGRSAGVVPFKMRSM
jgi:hypothetical protein